MSTSNPKSASEQSVANSTFSYAQAAKGQSPGRQQAPANPSSAESLASTRRTSLPGATITNDEPEGNSAKRAASEVRTPHIPNSKIRVETDMKNNAGEETHSTQAETHVITQASPTASPPQPATNATTSVPSSPDFGTASTSTLVKDDEVNSTQNGSSDSTWDKQSQTSQPGEKTGAKAESDKDQVAWDQDQPAKVELKEAPPPAQNIWQQRKEAQDAKAKAQNPSFQKTSLPSGPNAATSPGGNQAKGAEPSLDPKKQDPKKQDPKKKNRPVPPSNEEKQAQVGSRDQPRPTDPKKRAGEEDRANSRSARATEAMPPPPPPGDAISWPTPDSAQDEGKKKAQERVEKSDKEKAPAAKPHGKDKWTQLPYVPSAVFETPLPTARRGGRPPRGGREGVNRGGSASQAQHPIDKTGTGPQSNALNQTVPGTNERGTQESSAGRNALGSSRPKRAASAGPQTGRDQRRNTDAISPEKTKGDEYGSVRGNSTSKPVTDQTRRGSTATEAEATRERQISIASSRDTSQFSSKPPPNGIEKEDRHQGSSFDTQPGVRPFGPERHYDGSSRHHEHSRDFSGNYPARERGRGGYRGRGGGNHGPSHASTANGPTFSNGHPSQQQSYFPQKSQHHERHASQSYGNAYQPPQTPSRHYRSNSRSHSIPSSTPYGRFSTGAPAGGPHPAHIRTDLANTYGYQPRQQTVMSAFPFNPAAMDQMSLFGMVATQMEYYFSVDNLCKDMFLRKQMDSQGFVFLSVLAGFNRIKQLTEDMTLLRYVCHNSHSIELQKGEDGVDRLRKREGWQQWVLNMEERDLSAQNDGPTHLQPSSISQAPGFENPYSFDDQQGLSHQFGPLRYGPEDRFYAYSNGFPPYAQDASPQFPNGPQYSASVSQTPLSAAVPDFAPGIPPFGERAFGSPDSQNNRPNTFTDEQVQNLKIMVNKSSHTATPPTPPLLSASARTFSNGSIEGKPVDVKPIKDEAPSNEKHQLPPTLNGDGALEILDLKNLPRAKSPFLWVPPSRQTSSAIFWIKEKDTPIKTVPNDTIHESYLVIRKTALQHRELTTNGTCHPDMVILYQFWAHFLIRNFNLRMYKEFRQLAFDDAHKESTEGLKHLIQFYENSILGQLTIFDDIAQDFVDLVKNEPNGTNKLAFHRLRASWRSNALNTKNRNKISNFVDSQLMEKLES